MARGYLDFDLLIEDNEDGSHTARVVSSPGGEASARFRLPFSPLEIENFILRMGHTRARVRGADSAALDAARQFGSTLYEAVFAGDLGSTYMASVQAAEQQNKGLRLRLRLGDAPQLTDLPWELLYSSGLHDFVALSEKRPVVRYVDLPNPVRPLAVTPPLRILVVVSSPSDVVDLDVGRERARLTDAVAGLVERGQVELRFLEKATVSALQLELERSEVHILHFIGHGGYDEGTGDGTLMFEDEQGRGRKVPGSTLATLLNDHDPLRLLVLNACEGARSGVEDPFAGVALSVVRRGAPAVIAMQFEITDTAALTFANHFYLAVANGLPIDAACTAARKAVFAQDNQVEWATPVLYMRAPDGVVFRVTEDPALPSATSPPPQPAASAAAPLAADTAPVKPAEPDRSPAPRRRLPLVAAGLGALAAVAAVVVAGALLGGGDDPVDPTTPPTPEPNVVIASTLDVDPGPTREEWASQADIVCVAAGPDGARFSQDMAVALEALDPVAYHQAGFQIYQLTLETVDEIRPIIPQEQDVARVNEMLDGWDDMIDLWLQEVDAFVRDDFDSSVAPIGDRIDAATGANSIARQLGSLECENLFAAFEQP